MIKHLGGKKQTSPTRAFMCLGVSGGGAHQARRVAMRERGKQGRLRRLRRTLISKLLRGMQPKSLKIGIGSPHRRPPPAPLGREAATAPRQPPAAL